MAGGAWLMLTGIPVRAEDPPREEGVAALKQSVTEELNKAGSLEDMMKILKDAQRQAEQLKVASMPPPEPVFETDQGLESLLFEAIPAVVTPSKSPQSVERSTSVVTVITEEEISRSGARTIYELLKRVPGFFPTSQATWLLVGSRGLLADGNDHILLLVDGHRQNSIVGQGYQQQDTIPALEHVKRIEITRGPGSVIWGSSAVFGIINVITKDGTEAPGHSVTAGYGSADGMRSGNYLGSFAKEDGSVSGIVSFSTWRSDGFNRPDRSGGAAFNKGDAEAVQANVEFPWGEVGNWPPIDEHREGYDLYAKVNVDEGHRLLARVMETNVVYPWDTWLNKPEADLFTRKAYLEYQREAQIHARVKTRAVLFGDILLQNRFVNIDAEFEPGSDTLVQDQSNEELAFGGELSTDIEVTETNDLAIGAQYVRTKVGPNRDTRFDSFLNQPSESSPAIGVESGYDNNWAVYFEDTMDFNDGATTVFAGGRFDQNDYREDKGVLLPRAGVIQKLFGPLTAKYVFNTGYLRPNAVYSKTVGVIVDQTRGPTQDILRVRQGEQVFGHDIQLFLRGNRGHFAVTGYRMDIYDYISFDANNTPQGYKNLGDVTTMGIELEGKLQPVEFFDVYGNYSFARAKIDEAEFPGALTDNHDNFLNYPRNIVNLGCDFLLNRETTFNMHVNWWSQMPVILPIGDANYSGETAWLDGEAYFDLTLYSERLLRTPVDGSFSVMNIFNNTDALGLVVNNGFWYPRGRSLVGKLSVKW